MYLQDDECRQPQQRNRTRRVFKRVQGYKFLSKKKYGRKKSQSDRAKQIAKTRTIFFRLRKEFRPSSFAHKRMTTAKRITRVLRFQPQMRGFTNTRIKNNKTKKEIQKTKLQSSSSFSLHSCNIFTRYQSITSLACLEA